MSNKNHKCNNCEYRDEVPFTYKNGSLGFLPTCTRGRKILSVRKDSQTSCPDFKQKDINPSKGWFGRFLKWFNSK